MKTIEEVIKYANDRITNFTEFKKDIISLRTILQKHEIIRNVAYFHKPDKNYIFYVGPNYCMASFTQVGATFVLFDAEKVYELNAPNTFTVDLDKLDKYIKDCIIVKNDITEALYRCVE